MKAAIRSLLVLLLAALMTQGAFAQEKAKKPNAAKGKKGGRAAVAVRIPAGIELTAEQQAKVDELNKEYGPKVAALGKRTAEVVTPEQRKARAEAIKAANESGKKGAERKAAVEGAVSLSAEQKQQVEAIQAERKTLMAEINGKLREILTAEQQAKLPGAKKGTKKPAGEKSATKKKKNADS